ncbi:MAG: leucine-rich repeat domain-containing protein, partial [Spirochaetaceae bacterium]|nr:leucine-rich repeat domain-containing protein [Spirochaetaceae bacterium]
NNKLTYVTIPDGVTVVGAGAFYGNSLTSITIGANVSITFTSITIDPSFPGGFGTSYTNAGKAKGTYNLVGTVWKKQ